MIHLDFANTVFKSSLDLKDTIHYSLEKIKELTGLEFNALNKTEETHRTLEQAESLKKGLNSKEHLADRSKLLPYIKGPQVLELGSGSGGFLKLIRESKQDLKLLVGVEYSPAFFRYAIKELFEENYEKSKSVVCLVRTDITKMEIISHFYNSIIMASIIHEIKSFYSTDAVSKLFEMVYNGLGQNGRIIIYDGFRREGLVNLNLLSETSRQTFQTYLQQTPREITFEKENDHITIPVSDAIDFATKLQFDDPSTEYAEDYYPFTIEEYLLMLKKVGFEIRTIATFPEEIDYSRIKKHITVKDTNGEDVLTSDNNLLIVAEKVNQ